MKRGDIYHISKSVDTCGSEQRGGRPGIIVSNEKCNTHSSVVEVVFITTKKIDKNLPTHVPFHLFEPSIALCEQVHSVSVERIENYLGHVTDDVQQKIDKALRISLMLDKNSDDIIESDDKEVDSMNELQIFENSEFGKIRAVTIDGEPWLVGKDCTDILGYSNSSKALIDHVDDEDKLNNETLSSLGQRGGWLINESGLYSLILSSKLPNAKQFKRWITSEVIPSIRKHGAYMTPETLEAAILNPDTIIKIATALKGEQDKNKALEAMNSELAVNNQIMKPKADYFDDLVDRGLSTNIRETAKELKVPERQFISELLERKYLYRSKGGGKLTPYARMVKDGLFELKECYNDKTQWAGIQTLITPKGRELFRSLNL